ncbi:MAG: WG repeat-containing protein [Paludibacteraceae bacterium]|nr:WG repeat-containing protein [Paludibacteraceae bacterium]
MKKVLFMTCALVAGFALTSCESDQLTPTGDTTKLWVAGEDDSNLLGYINSNGKMVIPADYETVYNFSCGWAMVREDGEIKYIDKNGISAKNLPYADTYYSYFYYNMVTFKIDGLQGKWDNNFKEVIPAKYKSIGINTDAGLMWFTEDGKEYGFINEKGKQVIEPKFDYCSSFKDGICVVAVDTTTDSGTEIHYGVIDTKGEYLISPQENEIYNMGEGRIAFYNSTTKKWGIWDKNGNEILPATYDDINAISCGLALVEKNSKYGYIDKNGNEVIAPLNAGAMDFVENMAWIQKSSDSRIELIDKNGEQIMRLKEEEYPQGMFHNGLCPIYNEEDQECRYIDKNGNVVYAWESKNGLAAPARRPSLREIGLREIAGTPKAVLYIDRLHGMGLTQEGEIVYKD